MVSYQGEYSAQDSSVINLIQDGIGNCEARAKLMVMLIEDVFKGKLIARVQTMYIEDPVTHELTKHVRAVAVDKKNAYIMELPEVRVVPKNRIGTTYAATIFAEGFIAKEKGKSIGKKSVDKARVKAGNTDTVFSLPDSPIIEKGYTPNIGKSEAARLRLEKLSREIWNIVPQKGRKGGETVERKIGDFSYIRTLTDAAVAEEMVRLMTNNNTDFFLLSNLTTISDECAEILARNKGLCYVRKAEFGAARGFRLSPRALSALSKIGQNTYINYDGEFTPELAQVLSRLDVTVLEHSQFNLNITGTITPEAVEALLKNAPRENIYIFSEKAIPLETVQKIADVPEANFKNDTNDFEWVGLLSKVPMEPAAADYVLVHNVRGHSVYLGNVNTPVDINLLRRIQSHNNEAITIQASNGAEITHQHHFDLLEGHEIDDRPRIVIKVYEMTVEMAQELGKFSGNRLDVVATNMSDAARAELFKAKVWQLVINGKGYSNRNGKWQKW